VDGEKKMDNYYQNDSRRRGKSLPKIFGIVFLLLLISLNGLAKTHDKNGRNLLRLHTKQQEESRSLSKFSKFQVELYGGIIFLNPSDLNLFVGHDNRMQEFFYDSYFDYLVATGQIQSWSKNEGEERQEIRRSYPIGGRIKYYLSQSIALSIGFQYISSQQSSDLDFQYFRHELSGERYNESITYAPYSLSAKAYIPTLGFHIRKRLKNVLVLEGFLTGGPMFARCSYFTEWRYEWETEGPNYRYITYSNTGALEEKGSGTGISLDFGGRISYPIIKSFAIFLEASYAYQVVKSISGPGQEERDGRSVSWDGTWGIKSEIVAAAWGELETEFPTNYWPENSEENKVKDFELDLSGFQLRLGLSFRF
jgi:hypothetical protein